MERYTGKGRGRVEGMDKATGRALYAADYYEENMLYLRLSDLPMPTPKYWMWIHPMYRNRPGSLRQRIS